MSYIARCVAASLLSFCALNIAAETARPVLPIEAASGIPGGSSPSSPILPSRSGSYEQGDFLTHWYAFDYLGQGNWFAAPLHAGFEISLYGATFQGIAVDSSFGAAQVLIHGVPLNDGQPLDPLKNYGICCERIVVTGIEGAASGTLPLSFQFSSAVSGMMYWTTTSAVPEPAIQLMLLAGLATVGCLGIRRRAVSR